MARWTRQRGKTVVGLMVLPFLPFAMLRWFEHRQVYHPYRDWDAKGDDLRRPCEDVRLVTTDGLRLSGWYFLAAANSPRSQLAVLVCHGNGGNISHRLELYAALLETGVNVFAFDYRGYGRSEGRPDEDGTYCDAQAAYAWLVQRGFTPDAIVVFGESLGGGVATELARREVVAGLILQSTFTSIPDLGAELFPFLPVRWIAKIRYDTHSKLPLLSRPLLVMHSRADGLIPFRHAERNFAAANEPKCLWEIEGDHNDALDADRARFIAGIEGFLARLTRKPTPVATGEATP
jgi:uncharacterized protein